MKISNIINQRNMKNTNLVEVLDVIRRKKSVTRKDIQKYTGLSWGGVSQIITQLMQKNLIVNTKDSDTAVCGRKPEVLSLNTEDNYLIGIDINLSGIYAVVINLNSDIIYQCGTDMNFKCKDELIGGIIKFITDVCGKYKNKTFLAIGVSMQGRVDEKNGISRTFEGIDEWENVPLRDILSERFELPVYLGHDPECLLTSADFNGDSILIRIDYGVGMSVKKDGTLISSEGMPEIGKTAVTDKEGRLCGRLYDYVTVGGIEKRGGCSLDEIVNSEKKEFLFDDMALKLGGALANAMLIFDVEKVFICGKMTDYKELYFEKMCSVIKECCGGNASVEVYDVKRAAIGAAQIAMDKKILVL